MIGTFSDERLLVTTGDGINVRVERGFSFIRPSGAIVTVLEGAESDGASVPAVLWSGLAPTGPHWRAAVLHDAIYRRRTLPLFTSREEADEVFLEALEACLVPRSQRVAMYEAVRMFGTSAWRQGHAPEEEAKP